MRRLTTIGFAAALAVASIGCETTTNTNVANKTNGNVNANSNVAVVVNNNSNMVNSNVANSNKWNANISREEYDKDKENYSKQAKDAGSTIGSGVNDGWLWTKTKAALATTDDLRDSTINVDVDNAIVTLKGTVANAAQKTKAESVAKGVQDVKSVKNELKVQAGDSITNQAVNGNTSTTKSNSNAK